MKINYPDNTELLALPVVRAAEFAHWQPGADDSHRTKQPAANPVSNSLSQAQERFLRAVIEHSGKPSSAYPSLAGIGTHQAIAARKKLIEMGFLREHRLQAAARGRTSVVLEPLPAAVALFAKEEK